MKNRHVVLVLCCTLNIGAIASAKPPAEKKSPSGGAAKAAPLSTPTNESGVKAVRYGERDVIKVGAKLRYTTLIVLPKNEEILDFACGDKEFWIVNGGQNLAYVKPAKSGSETNLNLITASGNIYSFVLSEVSETKTEPDLKVFVEPKEESMITAAGSRTFVSARELDDYRQQVELAKQETRQVKQSQQTAIDAGITNFLANVRFPYRFDAGKKPFLVRAMYNDDKFTYIQARPEETPALYEVLDGKPNLVNFQYKNGVYVVDKILARGYLAIGKQKLEFVRQD